MKTLDQGSLSDDFNIRVRGIRHPPPVQKKRKREYVSSHHVTLIQTPNEDITKKLNYGQIYLLNIDSEILNVTLADRMQ